MRFGVWQAGAGALTVAAMLAATTVKAQPDGQQQTTAQQQVPDAPKPQLVPQLNSIVPVAPAVPAADRSPASAVPNAPTPEAPTPSVLPASPVATANADDQGPPPEDATTFHLNQVHVNFVEVPFTVQDSKHALVPGLTYRDVRVFENGQRQHLAFFSTDPVPLSVVLVIDQSVTEDTMNKINASLAALQGAFTKYDEVAVVTYNSNVTKRDGFSAAQGARLGVVLDNSKAKGRDPIMPLGGPMSCTTCLNNHGVDPNTDSRATTRGFDAPEKEFHVLNDAVFEAAKLAATAALGRRRVVYVISDGKEYGSSVKQSAVIKYLQTNNIAVYATLVGDSSLPGLGFLDRVSLPLEMKDNILPRYTAATGGETDAEFRPRGIQDSFSKLSEMVRTQYTAGYYSHEPILDGKFRKVSVVVERPGLTVVAKAGYYPSAQYSGPAPATTAATQGPAVATPAAATP